MPINLLWTYKSLACPFHSLLKTFLGECEWKIYCVKKFAVDFSSHLLHFLSSGMNDLYLAFEPFMASLTINMYSHLSSQFWIGAQVCKNQRMVCLLSFPLDIFRNRNIRMRTEPQKFEIWFWQLGQQRTPVSPTFGRGFKDWPWLPVNGWIWDITWNYGSAQGFVRAWQGRFQHLLAHYPEIWNERWVS